MLPASRGVYLVTLQAWLAVVKSDASKAEALAKTRICGEMFNGASKGTSRKNAVTLEEARDMLLNDPVVGVRFDPQQTIANMLLPLFRSTSLLNATVVLTQLEKTGAASSSVFSVTNPHLLQERATVVQGMADQALLSVAHQIAKREMTRQQSEVVGSVGPEKGTILGADGSPVATPRTPFKPTAIMREEASEPKGV